MIPIYVEMSVSYKPTLVVMEDIEIQTIGLSSFIVDNQKIVMISPEKKNQAICHIKKIGPKSAREYTTGWAVT